MRLASSWTVIVSGIDDVAHDLERLLADACACRSRSRARRTEARLRMRSPASSSRARVTVSLPVRRRVLVAPHRGRWACEPRGGGRGARQPESPLPLRPARRPCRRRRARRLSRRRPCRRARRLRGANSSSRRRASSSSARFCVSSSPRFFASSASAPLAQFFLGATLSILRGALLLLPAPVFFEQRVALARLFVGLARILQRAHPCCSSSAVSVRGAAPRRRPAGSRRFRSGRRGLRPARPSASLRSGSVPALCPAR